MRTKDGRWRTRMAGSTASCLVAIMYAQAVGSDLPQQLRSLFGQQTHVSRNLRNGHTEPTVERRALELPQVRHPVRNPGGEVPDAEQQAEQDELVESRGLILDSSLSGDDTERPHCNGFRCLSHRSRRRMESRPTDRPLASGLRPTQTSRSVCLPGVNWKLPK